VICRISSLGSPEHPSVVNLLITRTLLMSCFHQVHGWIQDLPKGMNCADLEPIIGVCGWSP